MGKGAVRYKLCAVLALVVTAFTFTGCAYSRDRALDFLDMIELGFTVSEKPQIGLYWNSLDLLVAGYCDIDGYMVGWASRHSPVTPIHAKCYGLILSQEEIKWGREKTRKRYGGLLGIPGLIAGTEPADSPACVHFIPHIGWVGLVWSARYGQMVDFIVGWTTIDLGRDDGLRRKRVAEQPQLTGNYTVTQ